MIAELSPDYLRRLLLAATRADLVPAHAAGETGSVVGGGATRVTLRFEDPAAPDRLVRDARVRVLASAAPHGPAAVLLERITGARESAIRLVRADDLLALLGPALPPAVARAATTLLDALRRALDDGATAARTDAPMIGIACAAGTGCHSCWPDLRALLDEELPRPSEARTDSRAGPASDATSAEAVAFGLVAPLWRAQGIALASLAIEGEVVRVGVGEVTPGALASPIGAVAIARHALREALSDTVRVELAHAANA